MPGSQRRIDSFAAAVIGITTIAKDNPSKLTRSDPQRSMPYVLEELEQTLQNCGDGRVLVPDVRRAKRLVALSQD